MERSSALKNGQHNKGDVWSIHMDKATKVPFYHNAVTGESSWSLPADEWKHLSATYDRCVLMASEAWKRAGIPLVGAELVAAAAALFIEANRKGLRVEEPKRPTVERCGNYADTEPGGCGKPKGHEGNCGRGTPTSGTPARESFEPVPPALADDEPPLFDEDGNVL